MRQIFVALVIFFAGQTSFAQTNRSVITDEQKAQNWESFVLNHPGRKVARMTTSSIANTGDRVTLSVDLSPPCDMIYTNLIFGLPKPKEDVTPVKWLLTMRVDSQQTLFGQISYIPAIGDKIAVFTLHKLPQWPDLLQGMIIGQGIQMRADDQAGKQIASIAFSLYGFTASYNRIKSLCQQLVATRPAPNSGSLENLRQLPRSSDLPPNPNVQQVPTLPKHPNSGV
jgi:hypothetical protein